MEKMHNYIDEAVTTGPVGRTALFLFQMGIVKKKKQIIKEKLRFSSKSCFELA